MLEVVPLAKRTFLVFEKNNIIIFSDIIKMNILERVESGEFDEVISNFSVREKVMLKFMNEHTWFMASKDEYKMTKKEKEEYYKKELIIRIRDKLEYKLIKWVKDLRNYRDELFTDDETYIIGVGYAKRDKLFYTSFPKSCFYHPTNQAQ